MIPLLLGNEPFGHSYKHFFDNKLQLQCHSDNKIAYITSLEL